MYKAIPKETKEYMLQTINSMGALIEGMEHEYKEFFTKLELRHFTTAREALEKLANHIYER